MWKVDAEKACHSRWMMRRAKVAIRQKMGKWYEMIFAQVTCAIL
jgi:hypothetical protein